MQPSRNLYQLNQTTLLHAIAEATQADIGLACGHDKSWVSRFQNDQGKIGLDELLKFLCASGLRLTYDTQDEVTLSLEEFNSIVTMAEKGIGSYRSVAKIGVTP